jgi:hypothetical protein
VATSRAANKVAVPWRTLSWVCRSGRPGRTGRTGWVCSNAWIWDFSSNAQHDPVLGRVQVQPDHVADLGRKLRPVIGRAVTADA